MTRTAAGTEAIFALLDDASDGDCLDHGDKAMPRQRSSRLYLGWQHSLTYRNGDDVNAFFDALDAALAAGLHAVGLFDYEFGHQWQGLPQAQEAERPLATVLLFAHCERLDRAGVDDWLAQRAAHAGRAGNATPATHTPYAVTGLRASLQQQHFTDAIDAIHRYIEAGDTYQVNFTFPLHFDTHGDPVALYAALRTRQPVPYGALVALPDRSFVLSMSPELFLSHQQGQLTCRPMKGTAAVSGDIGQDAERARALQDSVKERSENLMIVDLLRNDLGRIAVTGSVKVPDLFTVSRYGSVLQMTSTVTATVRDDVGWPQVFHALYPCGSITGAPKRRTMQLLQQLENLPRKLYTGAIGWFEPPQAGRRLGDFMLSVPIRTLLLDAPDANDRRRGEMGVGAGIVHDSDAQAEYQECLLKARFLTGVAPGFELFETMHATREGCRHLERHLSRISASAAQLGFVCELERIRAQLDAACASLQPGHAYRLRLALSVNGEINIRTAPLATLQEPVRLLLSPVVMPATDPLLLHKTTLRRVYDQAWQAAEAVGAFDTLFFNERGELTEGGRCNVLVKLDGHWLTPPLACGLLPGVMRAVLLEDPALNVIEAVLTHEDLRNAEEIRVCNALRGMLTAQLVD